MRLILQSSRVNRARIDDSAERPVDPSVSPRVLRPLSRRYPANSAETPTPGPPLWRSCSFTDVICGRCNRACGEMLPGETRLVLQAFCFL